MKVKELLNNVPGAFDYLEAYDNELLKKTCSCMGCTKRGAA